MTKAAPKFLQGLQQLLYPDADISAVTLQTPSSSSSSSGNSGDSHAKAALSAASEMRIGTIFRRQLAQADGSSFSLDSDAAATAEAQEAGAEADRVEAAAAAAAASSTAASDSRSSSSSSTLPLLSMCLNLNLSLCSSSVTLSKVNQGFLLVVYNPLTWSYQWGVRIPVDQDGDYAVTGPDGQPVHSQLLPLADSTSLVWPASQSAAADSNKPTAELAVVVSAPPLGHAVYKVLRLPGQVSNASVSSENASQGSEQKSFAVSELTQLAANGSMQHQPMVLSNSKLQLEVGPAGISRVLAGNRSIDFSAAVVKYQGRFAGSGAYTFKAHGKPDAPMPSEVLIIEGPVVQEVRLRFESIPGAMTTRLWAGQSQMEVEWTVGPPPAGRIDWEVFVRYNSSIRSQGVWFTDANGREYQQRLRQYRPSFDLPASSAVLAGNIYPITTGGFLQDDGSAMHVAVDRAQGAVSLVDGQMDVHLHRVSAGDDGKGMQEALIDSNAVTGTHIVSFGLEDGVDAGDVLHTARHYEQVKL
jgi:hypothetical protein